VTTEQLQNLDRQYVWHPFTHMSLWLADDPIVITHGEGVYVFDSDGRRYIDGTGSLWCNVHGHRVPAIDHAIRAQLDKIAHSTLLGLAGEPSILLAEKLIRIAPPGLAKVFYSDSGATATEVAFKIAVQYWWNLGHPEKTEFVAIEEAYHGDTVGGMSVGMTSAFHKPYRPLMFKVHYAGHASSPPPLAGGGRGKGPEGPVQSAQPVSSETSSELNSEPKRGTPPADPSPHPLPQGEGEKSLAAHRLESQLAAIEQILIRHHRTVAAISIEPLVMGAAGMIVHPPGFTRGVRELADKYDVLLIADEVATGFGRTGRMFACEHDSVTPDLLCIGKGLTGGYLPVAATLATQKIFDAFLGHPWEGRTFFHGHTFTGNALGCAAALASIDLMEQTHLVQQVATYAKILAEYLEPLKALSCVSEIRQAGYMVGIDLVADRATRRPFDPKQRIGAEICRRVRRHGVLLRPLGDTIVINPPLVTQPPQLAEIVAALKIELSQLAAEAGTHAGVDQRGDTVIAGDF